MIRVLFVCAGNICRSPMAEGIFRKLVREHNLEHLVRVASAGTGHWHVGQGADPRTQKVLRQHQAEYKHVVRQICLTDTHYDLILAADRRNIRDLERMLPGAKHKLRLICEPEEVPDPYDGSSADFQMVYELLKPALEALLEGMLKQSSALLKQAAPVLPLEQPES